MTTVVQRPCSEKQGFTIPAAHLICWWGMTLFYIYTKWYSTSGDVPQLSIRDWWYCPEWGQWQHGYRDGRGARKCTSCSFIYIRDRSPDTRSQTYTAMKRCNFLKLAETQSCGQEMAPEETVSSRRSEQTRSVPVWVQELLAAKIGGRLGRIS